MVRNWESSFIKLNCAYVGRVTWRRIKGEMLWLLLPCGSLRGKIARNVSTFNFNGPPVPPMVPNLSTPCCNCRYLTRSWKKLRVSWGPSGTRKRRHWSRKLPIVWFLNSRNPQEPLRQSVPQTRSPHFFGGFPGFLHSETVWRVKDSKHWRRSCPGSRSYAARSRRSSTASSCWSRTSDGKAGGTRRAPEKWLNKKKPMKLSWNWLF